MSKYAVGTVAVRDLDGIKIEYQHAPREGKPEWVALDVPEILVMLLGDEDGEVRFTDKDISDSIEAGELEVR